MKDPQQQNDQQSEKLSSIETSRDEQEINHSSSPQHNDNNSRVGQFGRRIVEQQPTRGVTQFIPFQFNDHEGHARTRKVVSAENPSFRIVDNTENVSRQFLHTPNVPATNTETVQPPRSRKHFTIHIQNPQNRTSYSTSLSGSNSSDSSLQSNSADWKRGGKRIELSRKDIEQYVHLPQPEAAERVGVSLSTLKRRFYEVSIRDNHICHLY